MSESIWSESPMTRRVQKGELAWARALVLNMGSDGEAVRSVLESCGLAVELYGIGQPRHLASALSGRGIGGAPDFVILVCHGLDGEVLFDELAPELQAVQPFSRMGPSEVREHYRLSAPVVVSTGCETGTDAMAAAFLSSGATQYVAPPHLPDGDSSLLLLHMLFYGLSLGWSLDDALQRAVTFDARLTPWRLWPAG